MFQAEDGCKLVASSPKIGNIGASAQVTSKIPHTVTLLHKRMMFHKFTGYEPFHLVLLIVYMKPH
jgi:hypothetical protein